MIINLNELRVIRYRLNEVDNIDTIEYIVSFPSGYKHSFPVHLDRMTGELTINLPILKDIIKIEFDGMGYVQIINTSGVRKEWFVEVIRFVDNESTEVLTDTKPDFTPIVNDVNRPALRSNEVLNAHSDTLQFIMSNIDRSKK
jgi:hypothetical protein